MVLSAPDAAWARWGCYVWSMQGQTDLHFNTFRFVLVFKTLCNWLLSSLGKLLSESFERVRRWDGLILSI